MSVPDRASPRSDAMPTTRGTNFYLADPNLEFVCATVMTAEDLARARPHLVAPVATIADLRRRVAAWPQLEAAERELDARPVADPRYHALAGTLLLAEGQTLQRERQRARKLLVATLYVKRWLRPPPAPASALTARECKWLDAIVDWAPTPAAALAAVTGGPS
jgi:hypothetical protein